MSEQFSEITKARAQLEKELESGVSPAKLLKGPVMTSLWKSIPQKDSAEKAAFGAQVNEIKGWLEDQRDAGSSRSDTTAAPPIDITAPFAAGASPVAPMPAQSGGLHPITRELNVVLSIFERMGFAAIESRQLDDDYHMFGSLNFPEGHPARDDFDTFLTEEGLIAPAHTSTMQNRVIRANLHHLKEGRPIQVVVPGRCFRNEDVDPQHEHTLHQVEGVYVGELVNVGNLIATLQVFLEQYYEQKLEVRTQPAYFPFVEPGFEFAMSCPFCQKQGCTICSQEGWIEILGCGMIHPNVLNEAGVDPSIYTGFAWGFGLDRLVMMKYDIEDIRWLHSGRLDFLEQFS